MGWALVRWVGAGVGRAAAPVSVVVQPSSSWMVGWPAITTAHVYSGLRPSATRTWSMPTATTQSVAKDDTLSSGPVVCLLLHAVLAVRLQLVCSPVQSEQAYTAPPRS